MTRTEHVHKSPLIIELTLDTTVRYVFRNTLKYDSNGEIVIRKVPTPECLGINPEKCIRIYHVMNRIISEADNIEYDIEKSEDIIKREGLWIGERLVHSSGRTEPTRGARIQQGIDSMTKKLAKYDAFIDDVINRTYQITTPTAEELKENNHIEYWDSQ